MSEDASNFDKYGKPNLLSLRGDYTIPEPVKKKFGLETLLKTNAGSWINPTAFIDGYFVNWLIWEPSFEKFFKALSSSLKKVSTSDSETSEARNYTQEVSSYIISKAVINKVRVYYQPSAVKAE